MIDLKFLLKGHSFMRPDRVFRRINTAAKDCNIELPHEWFAPMMQLGTIPNVVAPADFIEFIPLFCGLFTIWHYDETGVQTDKITTYAWYRFLKNDAGKVVIMVHKEIQENIPWQTLNIQKKRGLIHHEVETLDRPYCVQNENSWEHVRREIQLEKQWDLYDLAQEFLSDEAKQFYFKPTQNRPTQHHEEIIEADDEITDENDNTEDLHDLFDSE